MAKKRILLTALAAGIFAWGNLAAQENDFDLSSQRAEAQDVLKVPGHIVDHGGLIINPTPHQLTLDKSGTLDVSAGIRLIDKQKKFADCFDFLTAAKSGVNVTVNFGEKAAANAGVKDRSGAYALSIGSKGITITGYDERGAFYGIQTLRQIVESPISANGKLPWLTVNDYPDLKKRGVVEGFYGTPWSHQVRLSLIDFYGRFKLNSYLYGPKDDPYHSCPN